MLDEVNKNGERSDGEKGWSSINNSILCAVFVYLFSLHALTGGSDEVQELRIELTDSAGKMAYAR
jgi:hypothetical protein